MKLLLFDIDLTLISTAGAGRRAMTTAFSRMFGQENGMDRVSFAGSTDPAIFRDAIHHLGIAWQQELQDQFKHSYLALLKQEIKVPRAGMHIKPGIEEILQTLCGRKEITLALLTGNWADGAKTKLEHFDLFRHFEFGAFADDSWVRADLPAVAARRFFDTTGRKIAPENILVIGDTPRDVACGKPFGTKTVAVATGYFSLEELEAAEPDYLFPDFSDANAFLSILGS
ncbi:MAG: HAD family hydrolase [bacterium]